METVKVVEWSGDGEPQYLSTEDIPLRTHYGKWVKLFDGMADGIAVMFRYNNRQRAHQVRATVASSTRYSNKKIHTRIIHGEPAIHNTNDWLLYIWRE